MTTPFGNCSVPFVTFTEDGPRCYVCSGPDDFAVRAPDETLRAILCDRHVYLGEGSLVRDRRPMRSETR